MPPAPRRGRPGREPPHDPVAHSGRSHGLDNVLPSAQVQSERRRALMAAVQHLKEIAKEPKRDLIKHEATDETATEKHVEALRGRLRQVQTAAETILTVIPALIAALPRTANQRGVAEEHSSFPFLHAPVLK